MNWNFDGKVAVVTGASRGIGEATVRGLDAGGAESSSSPEVRTS